jgi:multidrug resistance efflux pump
MKNDISEKLLHTNLKELLGGKGGRNYETPQDNSIIIPPIPPNDLNNEDNRAGNNNRMPELRSSEVDEVLNHPPAWLVRWGITVFFFVLMILLGVSWFVEYPDLVNSSLKVLSVNTPKSVNAKTDGRLMKLMTTDDKEVQEGDFLAYIESTANHEDVLLLDKVVNQLITLSANNNLEGIYKTNIPQLFNLGELQKSYQTFQGIFVQANASMANGTNVKKKNSVNKDIHTLLSLQENTKRQLELQEKDVQMAYEEFQSQQRLSEKGLVSKQDTRSAESRYLSKKQSFEQAKTGIDNNRMNQNQKRQDLIELDKTIAEQRSSLVQSINTLKSDIEAWKQRYIITAPITGKVSFLSNLQENQLLKEGQELLYILPNDSGYFGEMFVGQYNFGKIKIGQEVIIKFQSYPYQEFGTVQGKIEHISDIPKDTAYLVKISFPKGLITSANKKLPFRNGMTATGDIITENLRLIEKFFYNIRKTIKR